MKTVWFSGLSAEEKTELKKEFLSSPILRKKLIEIANFKLASARKEMRLKDSYESPNWAYKQADLCGYERALYEIISLV